MMMWTLFAVFAFLVHSTVHGQERFREITRGVSRTYDTFGNQFCFAFIKNEPGVTSETVLKLFVSTPGNSAVQFIVERIVGVEPSSTNHSVNPNQVLPVLIPPDAEVKGRIFLRNTIVIRTVNSDDKLQVLALNDNKNTADFFLAVPIREQPGITAYDYAQFSSPKVSSRDSTFLVAVCEVDGPGTSPTSLSFTKPAGPLSVRAYRRGRGKSVLIQEEDSVLNGVTNFDVVLSSSEDDLTGFRVSSALPIGFMVGHECGHVPLGVVSCDHMVEQAPPSYTWGYNFITVPFARRVTGYVVKILPRYKATNNMVTYFCEGDSSQTTVPLGDDGWEIDVTQVSSGDVLVQRTCYFETTRPSGAMQYAKGQQGDDFVKQKDEDIGDPAMAWIAPVGQYMNDITFVTGIENDLADFSFGEFINVVVPAEYYSLSMIKLDGVAISEAWNEVMCAPNEVCAYQITKNLMDGDHTLVHENPDGRFTATVYGWGSEKGYMYPAGFAMDPIGEVIYSLHVANRYLGETTGPFEVTVIRSGDINVASSIDLVVTMATASNGPSGVALANVNSEGFPNNDILGETVTINFASGETEHVHMINIIQDSLEEDNEKFLVTLVEKSGVMLGEPSSESLVIVSNELRFNPITYSVMEGMSDKILTLKGETSFPVQERVQFRIRDLAGTASGSGIDYVGFSEVIVINPTMSAFEYNVTIKSDNEFETPEVFQAIIDQPNAPILIANNGNLATITIEEGIVNEVRFNPVTYSVKEGEMSSVFITLSGMTTMAVNQQVDIRLTSINTGSATGGTDYVTFNDTITLSQSSDRFSYQVQILSDNDVQDGLMESFDVQLSVVDSSLGLRVDEENDMATVTIVDPYELTFKLFINDVNENEGYFTAEIQTIDGRVVDRDISLNIFSAPPTSGFITSAVAGSDFIEFNRTIILMQGSSSVNFNVTILDDEIIEVREKAYRVKFNVLPESAEDAEASDANSEATFNIIDDDDAIIEFQPLEYTVMENEGYVTVTVVSNVPVYKNTRFTIGENVAVSNPATSAADFVSFDGNMLTFSEGETTFSFNVSISPDSLVEDNENFGIRLTNVEGRASIKPDGDEASVTVLDDDVLEISFEMRTYVFMEEDSHSQVELIVVIEGQTMIPFIDSTVITFIDESAKSSIDFLASNMSYSVYPGNTTIKIPVVIVSDNLDEVQERFGVQLSVASGFESKIMLGAINSTTVVITDGNVIVFSIDPSSRNIRVPENNETVEVCVSRVGETVQTYTVTLESKLNSGGNMATAPDDFEIQTYTIMFSSGQDRVCQHFDLNPDNLGLEGDEQFSVMVTSVDKGAEVGQDTSIITIIDDDIPTFGGSNMNIREDQSPVKVCVELQGSTTAIDKAITITFTPKVIQPMTTGTASLDDFDQTPRSAVVMPGDTEACVLIPVENDQTVEGDENFVVELTSDDDSVQFDSDIIVTIMDPEREICPLVSDILFTIDGSDSIEDEQGATVNNFEVLKDAVLRITRFFSVSNGDVRVGVIQFSEKAMVEIPLGSITNDDQLTKAISDIRYQSGIETNTHDGLSKSIDELKENGREEVSQQIILFTDGEPTDPQLAEKEAMNASDKDIEITVIGINVPDVDAIRTNLQEISSSDKIIEAENVDALDGLVKEIVNSACPVVSVSFNSSNVFVDEDNGTVYVCLKKDLVTSRDILLDVTARTIANEATSPNEFVAETKQVTFNADKTQLCVPFTLMDDQIALEGDETFEVTFSILSSSTTAQVGSISSSIVTIKDDDVISFRTTDIVVNETEKEAHVCVERIGTTEMDISLTVRSSDFSVGSPERAEENVDYTAMMRTVVFPSDKNELCEIISITEDSITEKLEKFRVSFTSDGNIASSVTSVVSIVDTPTKVYVLIGGDPNNNPRNVSTMNYVVNESNGTVEVCLEVGQMFDFAFNVTFTTFPDSANDGTDYIGGSKTEVFPALSRVMCTTFEIVDDRIIEPEETFTVQIDISDPLVIKPLRPPIVTIMDDDVGILTGGNVTIPEENGEVKVCVRLPNGVSSVEDVRVTFMPQVKPGSPLPATPDTDFDSSNKSAILRAGETEVCVNITIVRDGLVEGNEEFCVEVSSSLPNQIFGDPDKCDTCVEIVDPPPPTDEKKCSVTEPLKVSPFHNKGAVNPPTYAFRGVCEHVLVKSCDGDQFTIAGDFVTENLATGRVGLRSGDNSYIINEDLSVRVQTDTVVSMFISTEDSNTEIQIYAGGVRIMTTRDNSGTVIRVEISQTLLGVRIVRDINSVDIFVRPSVTGSLNGLCGNETTGMLTVADNGMRVTDLMDQAQLDKFANSWQRQPNDPILREDRKECAVLRNDTVIGDPLYEAALWFTEESREFNYSLCYEIHGTQNRYFNLISDECVSVNGYYTPMSNPADGNIISSMGIRAVDNHGSCQNIAVVQNQATGKCELSVNGSPVTEHDQNGVSARLRHNNEKVRISVPNCDQLNLVLVVRCQTIAGQHMIRFDVVRGVNLRPTSHGLLGQFWNIQLAAKSFTDTSFLDNIPLEYRQYYNTDNLWLITVNTPNGSSREFVAEKYVRTWDNSKQVCLYAGNSQGGPAAEYGFKDSVIEGAYRDYILSGMHETDFTYSQFNEAMCQI